MWCCLCDPTFSRHSRTPTCDRHRQTQPMASTADAIASRGKKEPGFGNPRKHLLHTSHITPLSLVLTHELHSLHQSFSSNFSSATFSSETDDFLTPSTLRSLTSISDRQIGLLLLGPRNLRLTASSWARGTSGVGCYGPATEQNAVQFML